MSVALVDTKRAVLSESEVTRLSELEHTIDLGLHSFIAVAEALCEIRDSKLYRQHYDTFEDYVEDRWKCKRDRAYKLMAAAEAAADVSHGIHDGPKNERQARPLSKLKDAGKRREAWVLAKGKAGGGRMTGRIVGEAVKEVQSGQVAESTEKVDTVDQLIELLRDARHKVQEAKKIASSDCLGVCVDVHKRLGWAIDHAKAGKIQKAG